MGVSLLELVLVCLISPIQYESTQLYAQKWVYATENRDTNLHTKLCPGYETKFVDRL